MYYVSSLFEFLWSFMVYIVLKNNFCLKFLWHDFPLLNPETVRSWNGWRIIRLHLICNTVKVNKILLFITMQSTYLHNLGLCHRVANSCSAWQKNPFTLWNQIICAHIYMAPGSYTNNQIVQMHFNIFSGLSVRKFSFLLRTKTLYSLLSFNG